MRYKITIEYDGTNILGWQRQLDGPSVQEYLENALEHLLPSEEKKTITDLNNEKELSAELQPQFPAIIRSTPEIQGAGRTDAGVHALAQVAHFDLNREMEDWKLRDALNFHLREQNAPVVILQVEAVSENFNARFSAIGRGYIYRILNRRTPPILEKNRVWWVPVPLDVEKMRQGAKYLLGHHDFTSFRAAACQAKSPLKTLDKLEIETCGEEIIFTVEARSFLHHQVRNMVGTLKLVGDGHLPPEAVKYILEARDRKAAGPTAPACGLYLSKVMY